MKIIPQGHHLGGLRGRQNSDRIEGQFLAGGFGRGEHVAFMHLDDAAFEGAETGQSVVIKPYPVGHGAIGLFL